jgi:tetratricopeptide (TPR) repeat protein
VEGVLGHELGHVRHHHMLFYMVFFADFLLLGMFLYSLLPAPVRDSVWAQGWLLVLLVVVYWRVVFGYISRRFERQADAASCEMAESPAPLISALEKLAVASGGSRTARNWRHCSVAERVAFLSRLGPHPEALREHHAHVRTLKIVGLSVAALLGLVLYRGWGELFPSRIEQLENSPDRGLYQRWYELGEDLAKDGQFADAWKCYARVRELNPSSPDGYLGLAQLSLEEWENYKPRKAVELAEEAVRLIGKHGPGRNRLVDALKVLARAHFLAENARTALEVGRRALALDPQDRDLAAKVEVYRRAAEPSGVPKGPQERKPPE